MQVAAATDDFRVAYERSGSGAAVVLLHGWPGDHTDWDQLVPRTRPIRRRFIRVVGRRVRLLRLWTSSG